MYLRNNERKKKIHGRRVGEINGDWSGIRLVVLILLPEYLAIYHDKKLQEALDK